MLEKKKEYTLRIIEQYREDLEGVFLGYHVSDLSDIDEYNGLEFMVLLHKGQNITVFWFAVRGIKMGNGILKSGMRKI